MKKYVFSLRFSTCYENTIYVHKYERVIWTIWTQKYSKYSYAFFMSRLGQTNRGHSPVPPNRKHSFIYSISKHVIFICMCKKRIFDTCLEIYEKLSPRLFLKSVISKFKFLSCQANNLIQLFDPMQVILMLILKVT